MDEKELSPKQRKWLEASKKIGPGPMTKTERTTLEELYADMLPAEQQELYTYIQEEFAKAQEKDKATAGAGLQILEEMEKREWQEPSDKLKEKLSTSMKARAPIIAAPDDE